MAAHGPPVGPDLGAERPWLCLSNADGICPAAWLEALRRAFQAFFDGPVALNSPFQGGRIIRSHAREMPWVQLELSRGPFLSNAAKQSRVLGALEAWCEGLVRGTL